MPVSKGEALLHPVRMRIVMVLTARSGLTTQQIGQVLDDVPQATLYRHLNALTKAEILRVVEERPTGGTMERVYALNQGAAFLTQEDFAHATREDHMRYFMTFCVTLMRLFGVYLEREKIDFAADGVGYHTHLLHLDDDEFREFLTDLSNVFASYVTKEPSPHRKRRTFSTVLIPDDETDPTMGNEST